MYYYLFLVFKNLFHVWKGFLLQLIQVLSTGYRTVISSLLRRLTYLCTFITFDPMLCKSNNCVIYPLKLCFFRSFFFAFDLSSWSRSFLKYNAQYWNPYFSRGLLMTCKKKECFPTYTILPADICDAISAK